MSLDDHPPWCTDPHDPREPHHSPRVPIGSEADPKGWARAVDWGTGPRVLACAFRAGADGGTLHQAEKHDAEQLAGMLDALSAWTPAQIRSLAAQVRETSAKAFGLEAEA